MCLWLRCNCGQILLSITVALATHRATTPTPRLLLPDLHFHTTAQLQVGVAWHNNTHYHRLKLLLDVVGVEWVVNLLSEPVQSGNQ